MRTEWWKTRIEIVLRREFGENVRVVWHENSPEFIISDTNVNSVIEVCTFADALWKAYGGELNINPSDAYEVA